MRTMISECSMDRDRGHFQRVHSHELGVVGLPVLSVLCGQSFTSTMFRTVPCTANVQGRSAFGLVPERVTDVPAHDVFEGGLQAQCIVRGRTLILRLGLVVVINVT